MRTRSSAAIAIVSRIGTTMKRPRCSAKICGFRWLRKNTAARCDDVQTEMKNPIRVPRPASASVDSNG
jgi:hypothetical protein